MFFYTICLKDLYRWFFVPLKALHSKRWIMAIKSYLMNRFSTQDYYEFNSRLRVWKITVISGFEFDSVDFSWFVHGLMSWWWIKLRLNYSLEWSLASLIDFCYKILAPSWFDVLQHLAHLKFNQITTFLRFHNSKICFWLTTSLMQPASQSCYTMKQCFISRILCCLLIADYRSQWLLAGSTPETSSSEKLFTRNNSKVVNEIKIELLQNHIND